MNVFDFLCIATLFNGVALCAILFVLHELIEEIRESKNDENEMCDTFPKNFKDTE